MGFVNVTTGCAPSATSSRTRCPPGRSRWSPTPARCSPRCCAPAGALGLHGGRVLRPGTGHHGGAVRRLRPAPARDPGAGPGPGGHPGRPPAGAVLGAAPRTAHPGGAADRRAARRPGARWWRPTPGRWPARTAAGRRWRAPTACTGSPTWPSWPTRWSCSRSAAGRPPGAAGGGGAGSPPCTTPGWSGRTSPTWPTSSACRSATIGAATSGAAGRAARSRAGAGQPAGHLGHRRHAQGQLTGSLAALADDPAVRRGRARGGPGARVRRRPVLPARGDRRGAAHQPSRWWCSATSPRPSTRPWPASCARRASRCWRAPAPGCSRWATCSTTATGAGAQAAAAAPRPGPAAPLGRGAACRADRPRTACSACSRDYGIPVARTRAAGQRAGRAGRGRARSATRWC